MSSCLNFEKILTIRNKIYAYRQTLQVKRSSLLDAQGNFWSLMVLGTVPTVLYEVWDIRLTLPWLPIALIGTAVAFIVGFKNNATYGRLWEARQIWGAIINASRSWGIMVNDFVTTKNSTLNHSEDELKKVHTRLIYRHMGWLTALRFQLREPRAWENLNTSYNAEYRRQYSIPEHESKLEVELAKFLSEDGYEICSQQKKSRNTAHHFTIA